MKKIITYLTFISFLYTVNAQDLDHLMTRRHINCYDIEYNCTFLISDYYNRGLNDSLNYVIKYWENRCGSNELLIQTKTLIDIKNRTFNKANINNNLFNSLIDYRKREVYSMRYSGMHMNYYPIDYTAGAYNSFLDSLSTEIRDINNLTEEEKFIVDLYSGKAKLSELKTDRYSSKLLKKHYNSFEDSIKLQPEITYTVYSGLFMPNQSLSVLGVNGIIGIGIGGIYNKNSVDLLWAFKFGGPKEDYKVLHNGSLVTTDKYAGMYVGLEYGRTILTRKNSEFYLSAGFGGERITAIPENDKKDIDAKFLWALNGSAGLGYRYRYNHKNYVSVQLRYQYLDFNNPSGTKLEGNSFTMRLMWVFSSNGMRALLPKL
ncbi:MAG: hypothetical protein N4A72_08645 [Bacteroidales bacterium]|jgi:hypothetical protein|nr:hypothetical protein [Bacteroidales bacterium]